MFLRRGADVDKEIKTPLEKTMVKGSKLVVIVILISTIDVNFKIFISNVFVQNDDFIKTKWQNHIDS